MAIEIERKFLILSDAWKSDVSTEHHFTDGLITEDEFGKVRVRLSQNACWLTLKGNRSISGRSRLEFEYPIPRQDAELMLHNFCFGACVEKTRHCVPYRGILWSVDVYDGPLSGIVFAEVELESENQKIDVPPWVGREVTGNVSFSKRRLFRLAKERVDLAGLGRREQYT